MGGTYTWCLYSKRRRFLRSWGEVEGLGRQDLTVFVTATSVWAGVMLAEIGEG